MTDLLEKAIATVRDLGPDDQDLIARAMLSLAEAEEPEDINPDHLNDVLQGLAEMRRGEFASDSDVSAAFDRLGK